jgi:hypothetical protein
MLTHACTSLSHVGSDFNAMETDNALGDGLFGIRQVSAISPEIRAFRTESTFIAPAKYPASGSVARVDDCRPLILSLRKNFREGSLGKRKKIAGVCQCVGDKFASLVAKFCGWPLTLAPSRILLV